MFHSTSPVWDRSLKKMTKAEIQHLEKKEGKTLKRIFNLSITTPYIGLIIETGVLQNFEGQIVTNLKLRWEWRWGSSERYILNLPGFFSGIAH